ncbi:hypothetical protein FGO68_gene1260 [Halteria grandinella]|uniref:Uncharacterized protein n=1 Tax=Halteria grandinella TaxID=5974 RepID=A0A8J8SWH0_HALGN|nr:hypothetical protein FGO68_gene1260 [Halteria grandinella]
MRKKYDNVIRERLLKSAQHKKEVIIKRKEKEVKVQKFKITDADEARVAKYMPNADQILLGMTKEEIYEDKEFAVDVFTEYRDHVPDTNVQLFLGEDVFPDFFKKTRTKEQQKQCDLEENKLLTHLKQENRSLTLKVAAAEKDLKGHIERTQFNPLHQAEQKKLSKNRQKRIKGIQNKIGNLYETVPELEALIQEYKKVFDYFKNRVSQEQMQKRVDTLNELIMYEEMQKDALTKQIEKNNHLLYIDQHKLEKGVNLGQMVLIEQQLEFDLENVIDKNIYLSKKLQQIILINQRKQNTLALQRLRFDSIERISDLTTPIERHIIDKGWQRFQVVWTMRVEPIEKLRQFLIHIIQDAFPYEMDVQRRKHRLNQITLRVESQRKLIKALTDRVRWDSFTGLRAVSFDLVMHYYLTAIHAEDNDDPEMLPRLPEGMTYQTKGETFVPVSMVEFKDLVTIDGETKGDQTLVNKAQLVYIPKSHLSRVKVAEQLLV